jgi:hypothetical protein
VISDYWDIVQAQWAFFANYWWVYALIALALAGWWAVSD